MNISIFKTIYFNLYYLSFRQALKFPIRVARNTKILNMGKRSSVILQKGCKLLIGLGESFALGGRTGWDIADDGRILFKGDAIVGRGTQIIVNAGACLEVGKNFYCNANCIINAGRSIKIGDDCLIGWNVEILDGDGHKIIQSKKEKYEPIEIMNHVWLASHVMILKGTRIESGCVIAANSCITKSISKKQALVKNNEILKYNIDWEI